jgi:RNA polymerase sigma-70 factor (ECF subfamily)
MRQEPSYALRELSDQELVLGCLREERKCQEALYGRYSRRMYAVCLRYARHQLEAQDLLQDGFVKVFDKLHHFRMEGSLEGWIRRIMVTTCISQYRKKAFKQERFGLEHLPEEPVEPVALDALGQVELQRLIADLPDGYRIVFNLFAIEGYDHSEISAMLGCGESTSRSQLAKARRMLQQRLGTNNAVLAHAGKTSH